MKLQTILDRLLPRSGTSKSGRIKIERFCYSDEGTFGKLILGGKYFYTCEPPWRYNHPFISCIPEGEYEVVRDLGGAYRYFRIMNVPDRTEIEFHPGNIMLDTEGCILVGSGLGYIKNHWAVTNSNAAMRDFYRLMMKEKISRVKITNVVGEQNDRA